MVALDKAYYVKRMATELRMADEASSPIVGAVHRELAEHYKQRLITYDNPV